MQSGEGLAPVTKVERLPPACEPVQVYVPHIKPCGPVEAVNACGPVNTQETVHLPFVFAHLGYKVDRLLHVTAYKLKASKHSGYAKEYSPAPWRPAAPVSTAPASTLPPARPRETIRDRCRQSLRRCGCGTAALRNNILPLPIGTIGGTRGNAGSQGNAPGRAHNRLGLFC